MSIHGSHGNNYFQEAASGKNKNNVTKCDFFAMLVV